jgi:CBS-domain-containing membrane protein
VFPGATALLAAVNTQVRDLGWYYLPVILLSSTLALAVALMLNNIQRRYPVFWFQPAVTIPAPVDPSLGGVGVDSVDSSIPGPDPEKRTTASTTGSSISPQTDISNSV